MRVAVTGAAGFIGSHITIELANLGHKVLAMDDCSGGNRSNLPAHENILFCHIDLRSTNATMYEFEEFKPEVVYHLAANAREGASFFQPISVVGRNVGAYVNVLTAGIKHGMRRMILFSSMAVYGKQRPPFDEDMDKKPVDVYGLAKAQMEDMTEMLSRCHGFEYIIFRPHNVFGERQALNDIHRNVIGIWMNKIMRGEKLTIYGNGLQQRAFSYIGDSLPCYIRALDGPSYGVFNIGSNRPMTIIEAAADVVGAMGVDLEGTWPESEVLEFLPDRHGEVKYAYSDHKMAERYLGFVEMVGWREGIKRMAEWAKKKGAQEWRNYDEMEIPNEKMPKIWR